MTVVYKCLLFLIIFEPVQYVLSHTVVEKFVQKKLIVYCVKKFASLGNKKFASSKKLTSGKFDHEVVGAHDLNNLQTGIAEMPTETALRSRPNA